MNNTQRTQHLWMLIPRKIIQENENDEKNARMVRQHKKATNGTTTTTKKPPTQYIQKRTTRAKNPQSE